MISMMAEKRGMLFMVSPVLLMMKPPMSIPTAAAGRFKDPGKHEPLGCYTRHNLKITAFSEILELLI